MAHLSWDTVKVMRLTCVGLSEQLSEAQRPPGSSQSRCPAPRSPSSRERALGNDMLSFFCSPLSPSPFIVLQLQVLKLDQAVGDEGRPVVVGGWLGLGLGGGAPAPHT